MVSPRFKNVKLWVLALHDKDVREIDESGKPLMACRLVGKLDGNVLPEGEMIPYHSHYVARLKEGALKPMDLATAELAGVPFMPAWANQGKEDKPATIVPIASIKVGETYTRIR